MLEDLLVKDLVPLERNPRRITKEQMEKLCASIKEDPEFLRERPILVNLADGKHQVYAGNQRLQAAKKLKMKTVPCSVSVDLDPDIIKKRIIKDNKTYGEFDFDILANEWDYDLLLESGFIDSELGNLGSLENLKIEDDVPSIECEKCLSCGQKVKGKK